ncbi:ADP-heptose--LPS heptosyltransferase [Flavobacterium psychrophilum]|nr:ADP-heptose--LPS heptosyltransferase [Flavobacterium psychrophilum]AOE52369.1 ADP-heptose--LPS heptosyltransferase [Flavobacterium psychrophilum]
MFKTKVNAVRRKIMKSLTGNVGESFIDSKNGTPVIKRVLITRPNHRLGNLLLITPLVQEITATFPDCKIDLFVKGGLTPIVFKNYPAIDRVITLPKKPFKELIKYAKVWVSLKRYHYDMVINIDSGSSSGRLSTRYVTAKNKIFGENIEALANKYNDYMHMAKKPVYNLRYFLGLLGFKENNAPVPPLNLRLDAGELADAKQVLDKLVPDTKRTIAVFTYATGAKCYSEEWWGAYYNSLTTAFPDYNFIEVLPVENISKIGFKAPSFYSKDVREIAALIANTAVFIGADSGIMHLAASSLTPTIGLFSVTNPVKYEPYGNGSIAINTNEDTVEKTIAVIKEILNEKPFTAQYA